MVPRRGTECNVKSEYPTVFRDEENYVVAGGGRKAEASASARPEQLKVVVHKNDSASEIFKRISRLRRFTAGTAH